MAKKDKETEKKNNKNEKKVETLKASDKKKSKKNKNVAVGDSSFDLGIKKIAIVVGTILVVFCVFYLITVLILNKNSDSSLDNDSLNEEASISYENIILGRSFSMSDDSYYVLYYDKTDDDISSTYSSLVSNYNGKIDVIPLYVVNMGDALNSSFASDTGNRDAKSASELKINGPTLIRFSQGNIDMYVEGEESITSSLK